MPTYMHTGSWPNRFDLGGRTVRLQPGQTVDSPVPVGHPLLRPAEPAQLPPAGHRAALVDLEKHPAPKPPQPRTRRRRKPATVKPDPEETSR